MTQPGVDRTNHSFDGVDVVDAVVFTAGLPANHHPTAAALAPHKVHLHHIVTAHRLVLSPVQRVLEDLTRFNKIAT